MKLETVLVEADGAIGRITLNRPERLNALGATLMWDLRKAAAWMDEQLDVRVVIVSGKGRSFSAGADLKDSPVAQAMLTSGHSWAERRENGQLGLRMADAIENMRPVTIARVQGHAIGGGLVLMAACDLRVVADDTIFSIPEVDLGIPLAWGGIPRLVREIGPAMTKELVMTCRRFTPAQAHALGMVNRVVPLDQLDGEAEALAHEIAAKPTVPVTITKEHVNAVTRTMGAGATPFADGDVLLGAVSDPESLEAGRAYTERVIRRGRTD